MTRYYLYVFFTDSSKEPDVLELPSGSCYESAKNLLSLYDLSFVKEALLVWVPREFSHEYEYIYKNPLFYEVSQ